MRLILLPTLLVLLLQPLVGFANESAVIPDCQDNIVVVIDASGSMREKMNNSNQVKMVVAKQALGSVLSTVPKTTHVGVLCFSGRRSDEWLYPLGAVHSAKLASVIQGIQPGGNTPLGAFMKKGVDRLIAQREKQRGCGSYRLLIVTDGEASDEELVDRYLPDILGRGITVDVIGVSMAQQHALATRVHSYRRADDPESLQVALKEVLAEVGSAPTKMGEEDEFELLRGLPDEIAPTLIEALATRNDEPIGSVQKAATRSTIPNRAQSNSSSSSSTTVSPPPTTTTHRTNYGEQKRSSRSWWPILLAVVIMFGILRRISRGGQQRRHR